jgi:hypothetical protein
MKKIIVTTTINSPTEATLKFSKLTDWEFLIVGDTKTPHDEYKSLEKTSNIIYLSPEYQEKNYKELSQIIGWKSIQRRNIGFVEAYRRGAKIIASVDDDNIPYDDWGKSVLVGKEVEIDLYHPLESDVFDPLSVTEHKDIWHRGFPLEKILQKNAVEYKGKAKRNVLIQADLWDGDPDIDAMARLTKKPIVKFDLIQNPFGSNTISPFNSQNTFIDGSVIQDYSVWPHVGRMDDIWASYYFQSKHKDSVIYNRASVYQNRNLQDLITNLEKEILGYRYTYKFINELYAKSISESDILPNETKQFIKIYKKEFNK